MNRDNLMNRKDNMQNFRLLGQRLSFNWGAVLFLLGHFVTRCFFMLSLTGKRRFRPY